MALTPFSTFLPELSHTAVWVRNKIFPMPLNRIYPILVTLFVMMSLVNCSHASTQSDGNQLVDSLLLQMTLQEKLGQLNQLNSDAGDNLLRLKEAIARGEVGAVLNEVRPKVIRELQRIAVEESSNRIPLLFGRDVIHGFKTVFPINLGMAATFNPELIEEGAVAAAREATNEGINWNFAPMVDVSRDPRWGRMAESFGEDPYLVTRMGLAMLKGFQGNKPGEQHTMAACAKHFAGYGAAEGGRDYNTVSIPEIELWNTYFPPFLALEEAGVATFMTGFNELNGIPATGNRFLFREVLKERWGFQGFVVSDWSSVTEMLAHGFAATPRDAAMLALQAGVDMEMASTAYSNHLKELVSSGIISEELINDAVRRILVVKHSLGLFQNPYAPSSAGSRFNASEHLDLAKKMAIQSLVLLKNDAKLLPLQPNAGSIAVIGPMANDRYEQLGTWVFDGDTNLSVTPLMAIRDLVGRDNVLYAKGLKTTRTDSREGFAEALSAARQAATVVFFAGEEAILTGEAHCRASLELPGIQNELITALADLGKPIVLVVMTSRPLAIGTLIEKVDAVLYAWHPGTMGGVALADVLFGFEVPSGKLPVTFPHHEGQIPVYYAHKNTGRPATKESFVPMNQIPVRSFQTSLGNTSHYLDIGFKPLFPFGYGLSYTTFMYSNLSLSSERVRLNDDSLSVAIDLANTGTYAAEEVVQLYVRDKVASITRPVKELKAFKRVAVKPGETKKVFFSLDVRQLGFYNAQGDYLIEPGDFQLWVGGSSDSGLTHDFSIIQ